MATSVIPVNQTVRIAVNCTNPTNPHYLQGFFVNGGTIAVSNVCDTATPGTPFLFNFQINPEICNPTDWVLAGIGNYKGLTGSSTTEVQICGYINTNSVYVPVTPPISIPIDEFISFKTMAPFNCYLLGIVLTDSTAAAGNISFSFQYYSPSLATAGQAMPITFDPPIINDQ